MPPETPPWLVPYCTPPDHEHAWVHLPVAMTDPLLPADRLHCGWCPMQVQLPRN